MAFYEIMKQWRALVVYPLKQAGIYFTSLVPGIMPFVDIFSCLS